MPFILKRLNIFLLQAIILSLFIGAAGQEGAAIYDDGASANRRLAAFEKAWNTVNANHFDPNFGGIDWAAIKRTYETKARSAKSDDELHALLRQMLGELKLSHFGIYAAENDTKMAKRPNGTIGITVKIVEQKPIVFRVEAGSPAAEAGISPGYFIEEINGQKIAEILTPIEAQLRERRLSEQLKKINKERAISAALSTEAGTNVKILFALPDMKRREVLLKSKALTREISEAVGNFPGQLVEFESKRLPGGIGYIGFNIWVVPQMAKLRAALREFADAEGLIIDLRGNPGGIGGLATGLAGLLVEKETSLGTMRFRSGELKFVAYPQPKPFSGPVVLLTDHGSASTSEVFAAGLQETGRAKIVGEVTAGAVLPSIFEKLPTGAIFQYAISDYRSPGDTLIEGRGVFPDFKVALDPARLVMGIDSQLEAATRLINAMKSRQ